MRYFPILLFLMLIALDDNDTGGFTGSYSGAGSRYRNKWKPTGPQWNGTQENTGSVTM